MESPRVLISVIVAAYNAEKSIEKCIYSILYNSMKEIEIIIVDDGSNDSTLDIIGKLALKDHRIRVFSKENGGAASARNFGLNCSRGEYVIFVDADDYIERDMLLKMYDLSEKNNAEMCVCGMNVIDEGDPGLKKTLICPQQVQVTVMEKNDIDVIQKRLVFKGIPLNKSANLYSGGGMRVEN